MGSWDVTLSNANDCFTYRVAALIIKEGKLLMSKHVDYPCHYTVGGRVRIHETSEEAVVREVYEETGIRFEIERLVFVQERFYELKGREQHEIVFFYLMKDNPEYVIKNNGFTDQGTKETLHWIPIRELEKSNVVPKFLRTNWMDDMDQMKHIVSRE